MEYFLRLSTLGECPTLTIDKERFSLLKNSKHILSGALAIEEEYEIVISNYIDLEKESINTSIFHMTRNYQGYADSFDARLALNRRLMSLLTSVKLYIDTLESHCKVCLPNENDIKDRVKQIISNEYDKKLDYRFMEELRKYYQHKGTAVHIVSYGGRWTSLPNDDGFLEYSSSFMADKTVLSLDGLFKKQVISEMSDKIDLMVSTRSYIESISMIHNNIRKIISKNVNESRAIIQTAITDYKATYNKEFIGLTAYVFNDNVKVDDVLIFLNWDDIRLELEKRNKNLVNLKRRYVTGQSKK